MSRDGTMTMMTAVGKRTPNPEEMAMSVIIRAWEDVSVIMGTNSPKAVMVVRIQIDLSCV